MRTERQLRHRKRKYRKEVGECEWQNCEKDKRLTVDHITPRAVAELLGWSRAEIEREENWQVLCWPHHEMKDESTQDRVDLLRRQMKGRQTTIDDYRKIRGDIVRI